MAVKSDLRNLSVQGALLLLVLVALLPSQRQAKWQDLRAWMVTWVQSKYWHHLGSPADVITSGSNTHNGSKHSAL